MADVMHEWTDKQIEALERRLAKEYAQAEKEVQEKLDKYMERFEKKDEAWRKQVESGEKTKAEYKKWRTGQMAVGKRWEQMRDTIAQDYANTNAIARDIVGGETPNVYARNFNYGTYTVERDAHVDTMFTLYSRDTVAALVRDNPQLLPNPGKATENRIYNMLDVRWNRQQIQSVMLQGILQGESIPKIARRLAKEVGDKNMHAAVRNARTAMTAAQNKGRLDSYNRAQKMGIDLNKRWLATHDGRTRHWHRELDEVSVPVDKPFENDYGKIEYPGDPKAHPANVYNCRCTLIADVKKVKSVSERLAEATGNYQEWEGKHESATAGAGAALIGVSGIGYKDEQRAEMQRLLDNAPQEIRDIWQATQNEFGGITSDDTVGAGGRLRAYYDATTNMIHMRAEKDSAGNEFSAPFQTYFHERFHNIDKALGKGTASGWLSTEYRDKDGKSLEDIIMGEFKRKFSTAEMLEDPAVRTLRLNIDTANGGMGGYSWAASTLGNWRRFNGIDRSDARYSSLSNALQKASNDPAGLEKIVRANSDVFSIGADNFDFTDADGIRKNMSDYISGMKSAHETDKRSLCLLSDTLEKFSYQYSGVSYPLGYGHGDLEGSAGVNYYEVSGNLEREAVANVAACEVTNKAAIDLFKAEMPETYAAISDMIKGATNGKR